MKSTVNFKNYCYAIIGTYFFFFIEHVLTKKKLTLYCYEKKKKETEMLNISPQ